MAASEEALDIAARYLFYIGLLTSCWPAARVHGVTISDLVFLLALLIVIFNRATQPHTQAPSVLTIGMWIGLAVFIAGGVVSTIAYSKDPLASLLIVGRPLYLVIAWFWLAAMVLTTREKLWLALKFWLVSASVSGLWAVGQTFGVLPGDLVGGLRSTGLTEQVNELGGLEAAALGPAIVLMGAQRIWGLATGAILVGLLLSGSIGAGLAAAAAVLFVVTTRRTFAPVFVLVGILAFAVIFIQPVREHSPLDRLNVVNSPGAAYNRDTLVTRLGTYEQAWHRIENEPLLGTGFDKKSSEVYVGTSGATFVVHNQFLGVWYQGGVLALIGLTILLGSIGALTWRVSRGGVDTLLGRGLRAGFMGFLVVGLSEPVLYQRYWLVPALLALALAQVSHSTARQHSWLPRREPVLVSS